MRQTSSIALGRPRLAQEWPPGPSTRDAGAQAADRIDGDVQQAVALERQRLLGLQLGAGSTRPGEVAEPFLADRERDGQPLGAALARDLLDDLDARTRRRRRCRRSRAAQPAALERGSCGTSRANTVSTCASSSTRGRPSSKRQIRLPAASTLRAPGAPGEAPLQPRDALALVERRRGHACQREQVVEGIVRGAHAARTLSGRDQAPAMARRPSAPRARKAAAASIAASTLKPRSRAWAISITCSTASAS